MPGRAARLNPVPVPCQTLPYASPDRARAAQVALYAAADDEGALLDYLGEARDPLGAPLYEPQFALRVARQGGRLKACVRLLCELSLYEVWPLVGRAQLLRDS